MKIIIIPDSFKGSLSTEKVSDIIKQELATRYPHAEILAIPFADGGESTLTCYKYAIKEAVEEQASVLNSSFMEESVPYLIDKTTAVIESAKIIGLPQDKIHDPGKSTTYGIGQLILKLINRGITSFIIGLGGSCTNDAGAGMLNALGIKFYHGRDEFIPVGNTLNKIERISLSSLLKNIEGVNFTIYTDVRNPLLGKQGATFTFARQKGAKEDQLQSLEDNINHYHQKMKEAFDKDCSSTEGSGAAGGLGYAFALLSSKIVSGGEALLDLYHFDKLIKGADLIITGEGKTDASSLQGKAISIIARHAVKENIPLVLLSGYVEEDVKSSLKEMGFSSIYSIDSTRQTDLKKIIRTAEEKLRQAVVKYIRC